MIQSFLPYLTLTLPCPALPCQKLQLTENLVCLQIAGLAARLQEIAQEDYRVYHRVAAAVRRGVSSNSCWVEHLALLAVIGSCLLYAIYARCIQLI